MDTAEAFVRSSMAGYSAAELKDILHVKTKHALTHLVRCGRLKREQMGSVYVYLPPEGSAARQQRNARKIFSKQSSAALIVSNPDLAAEKAKATVLLFCTMLDERQRRLYAGLESLNLWAMAETHTSLPCWEWIPIRWQEGARS